MRRVRQRQLRHRKIIALPNGRLSRVRKVGRLHGGLIGPFGLPPRLRANNWLRGWNRRVPR